MEKDYVFLFDLDATITKIEILPYLAQTIGIYEEIKNITEQTMLGELPFENSFLKRVEMLKEIPISKAQEIIREIPLNRSVTDFIRENKKQCYIVTGNLDVWIASLMEKLQMTSHVYSSHALVKDDRLIKVDSVLDKYKIAMDFSAPFVAVGDGNNDADMLKLAEIGIGFGSLRALSPAVMASADYAVYTEDKLCQFLKRLL